MAVINTLLIYLILAVRPLLGPACCRFTVSCTQYAILQLKEKPTLSALWAILKRLLSCNPFFNQKRFFSILPFKIKKKLYFK